MGRSCPTKFSKIYYLCIDRTMRTFKNHDGEFGSLMSFGLKIKENEFIKSQEGPAGDAKEAHLILSLKNR